MKREKALHFVAKCCMRMAIGGIRQCKAVAKSPRRTDKLAPERPQWRSQDAPAAQGSLLHAPRSRLPGA